ncbi:dickkopf-related protein 2 isoform X1 [Anguilla rostrata]|uniref:dickkopf-related protein 2 isoform X1 n=1 Tax=Anguilla anguilla TaxID=7936 RepID=UPI0015B34227|nr:dickkopf-related protein 2 isoform X1 [Anguilla anguilla]XP_035272630.1 dickkopf-related protein 2 isoform X1 [Anguilla anguilla]
MLVLAWTRCSCVFMLLFAALRMVTSQKAEAGSKVNSIKLSLLEPPTAATNRSGTAVTKKYNHLAQQVYPCSNDKECSVGSYCHSPQHAPSRCLTCRRRKKRCNRDTMCCPGNRCSNYICISVSESVLPPHIPALEDHNKFSNKDNSWKKSGRAKPKFSVIKAHEGERCLRSSDCSDGHCCARHFWSKICKPVLRQGEVCTRQRKKGSHGLEIFQRCDCAKGLSCKVWKDATSSSTSRLHICQRV